MRITVLSVVLSGCACAGPPAEERQAPPANEAAAATVSATAGSAASSAGVPASASTSSSVAVPASAVTAGSASAEAQAGAVTWALKVPPLLFRDINTMADVAVRLYRDDGSFDEGAAAELDRVLWAAKEEDEDAGAPHVSRRLLRLVVKAAAHFDAREVQVISSHRGKARKRSRHRSGEAIDFQFPGVAAKQLAEVLRMFPRVGVGLYVHPRSQFVHLDVRDLSYHWIDGSPPGRSWREQPLPDPTAAARDAAYKPEQDLPEAELSAPPHLAQ